MKKFWLLPFLLCCVSLIGLSACNANLFFKIRKYGEEDLGIKLKTADKLSPDKAYIVGTFYEDRPHGLALSPFISLTVKSTDTGTLYKIEFVYNKDLRIYELPAGNYQIDNFHARYLRFSSGQIETVELLLNVDSAYLEKFELTNGQILYMGGYSALKTLVDDARSAKIHRMNDFKDVKTALAAKYKLDQIQPVCLNFSLETPPAPTPDPEGGKSYLAGRFYIQNSVIKGKKKYTMILVNIATKKIVNIDFVNTNDIQLSPMVEPGEYIVSTVLFVDKDYRLFSATNIKEQLDLLVPRELLPVITVRQGIILYIGDIVLSEKKTFRGSSISSLYNYDFNLAKQDLAEKREVANVEIAGLEE